MAIKAITDLTPEWFTPEGQEGDENPVKFLIKPLNGLQHAEIIGELRQEGEGFRITTDGITKALKYGLEDWIGVEGESGPINYQFKNLKYLPGDYHHLVAGEILRKTTISEDEQKK